MQIVNPTFELLKTQNHKSEEYKEYRTKWKVNPLIFDAGEFPLHLDIEVNTSCNLRCPMCFQSSFKIPQLEMKPEIVKALIDEGVEHGLCAIKLNYRGEPLLYTHLIEIIEYAKD